MKRINIVFILLFNVLLCKATDEYTYLKTPDKIQTYSSITTNISCTIEGNIALQYFTWDFYGDGTAVQQTPNGNVSFVFAKTGIYNLKVTAVGNDGSNYSGTIVMIVSGGTGIQQQLAFDHPTFNTLKSSNVGDSKKTNYAIIVNGAHKDDWNPVSFDAENSIGSIYYKLTHNGYDEANVFYLNGDNVLNQYSGVDNIANLSTFQAALNEIAAKIDDDDYFFLWIEDHGHGYFKPSNFEQDANSGDVFRSGTFDCRINTTKHDLLESDVKCRAFSPSKMDLPINSTNLNTAEAPKNYTTEFCDLVRFGGLNKWFLRKSLFKDALGVEKVKIYRAKYVSNFNLTKSDGTTISDYDPYIELIIDYLNIDNDKDGIVLKTEYDAFLNNNYNGAFIYNTTAKKGTYEITITDENQWQHSYFVLKDNIDGTKESIDDLLFYGVNADDLKMFLLFDNNLDNKLDVAIVPKGTTTSNVLPSQLVVAGTDNDNDGMIDGVDFNRNGNLNDYVGFDEYVALLDTRLYTNDLGKMINSLSCKYMTLGVLSCFSGGFIQDLSADGRVVMTATQKYYWGTPLYFNSFTTGFNIGNGTMDKAFNYTINNIPKTSPFRKLAMPQYDDNGDGVSHEVKLPIIDDDGCLGQKMTINGLIGSQDIINTTLTDNLNVSSPKVTVTNVTIPSPKILTINAANTIINSITVDYGATLIIDTKILNDCK